MKLSDFGQEMRVVPGVEGDLYLHYGPELPPHFHLEELRRMNAQVVKCRTPSCEWWLPIGARCPACAWKRDTA